MQKRSRKNRRALSALSLIASMSLSQLPTTALAVNGTWTNTAGGTWSTTGNWVGGTVADGIDGAAFFDTLNIPGTTTIALDSARTIGQLSFQDVGLTDPYILTNNGVGANILTLQVSAGTPTITAGSTTTISAVLAGTQGFNKAGSGTLTLSGANTYTGVTTVSAGTLKFGAAGAIPSGGALTIVAGSVDLGGFAQTVGDVTFGNGTSGTGRVISNTGAAVNLTVNGNIHFNGGGTPGQIQVPISLSAGTHVIDNPNTAISSAIYDMVFTQPISGAGGLSKSGTASTVFNTVLAAQNTYTGGTTVGSGVLFLGINNALPTSTDLNFTGAGTLALNPTTTTLGVTAGNYNQTVNSLAGTAGTITTGTGIFTVNQSTNTTFAGAISNVAGGGQFIKQGTGTLVLTGSSVSFNGTTTISGGTLQIGAGSTVGSLSGNIVNNSVLALNRSNSLTVAGDISGTGSVTIAGGGNFTYTGNNTYSGGTTISAGSLTIGNGATTGTIAGNVIDNAGLLFNRSDNLTYAGNISGTGTFQKSGGGALTLSGTNSYTGITTNAAGTLQFAQRVSLYNATPASWTAANTNFIPLTTTAFNIGGTGEFTTTDIQTIAAIGSASGGFRSGSIIGLDTTNNISGLLTYSNVIANPNAGLNNLGVTKLGTGTLVLTANNTFTLGTTIANGTLQVSTLNNANVAGPLGAVGAVAVGSTSTGGILQYTGGSASSNMPFSLNPGGGSFQIDTIGALVTFTGVISGSGGLTKTGAGSLQLTANNTYTGDVNLQGGILNVGTFNNASTNGPLGAGAVVALNGGTLQYSGASATSNKGVNVTGTSTFQVDLAGTTLTLSNAFSGSSFLIKTGSGILQLQNFSSFSGGVGVSAGTFALDTGSSAQTFAGSISGGATFSKVGSGTLTVTGMSNYSGPISLSAGTLNVDTNSFSASTFTGVISGSGGLTKSGANTLVLTNNNTFSGGLTIAQGTLSVPTVANFGVAQPIGFSGTVNMGSGSNVGTFQYTGASGTMNSNFTVLSGGGVIQVDQAATTLTINGNGIFNAPTTKTGPGTLNFGGGFSTISNSAPFVISNGTVMQTGGTLFGPISNNSIFTYSAGTFSGRLINAGTLTLNADFTAGDGMELDGSFTLGFGRTITLNGAGLDNEGFLTLAGGNLNLNGTVAINRGSITHSSTALITTTTNFQNTGMYSMSAGLINGTGSFSNTAGGTFTGNGTILTAFSNFGYLGVNGNLNISQAWNNVGVVDVQGLGCNVSGGVITNTGTIMGAGSVGAQINNNGTIRANGSLFITSGNCTNAAGAQIQVPAGSTVMYSFGFSPNAGTIALSGGTFDNNSKPLQNTGSIEGNGVVRTGLLTNTAGAFINFADAATSVFGNVNNQGDIHITNNTTTFFGQVTNTGQIKVTSGIARFLGNGFSMTVGGTYTSDPSDNYFNGLSILAGGTVQGGVGDRFFMTSNSTIQNAGTFSGVGSQLNSNTVTNSGNFTINGTLNETGNFTNTGTASISGTQNWTNGTTLTNSAGTTTLNSDAGPAGARLHVVSSGGNVVLNSSQHLLDITINPGAQVTLDHTGPHSNLSHIDVGALNLTNPSSGQLDMKDNALIIRSSDTTNATRNTQLARIISGQNGFDGNGQVTWDGPGIVSSTARANNISAVVDVFTVGIIKNRDLININGGPGIEYGPGNPWLGTISNVGIDDILIRMTYSGDTNLDGSITIDDYNNIDGTVLGLTSNFGWISGDFDFNGVITIDDYNAIDTGFLYQGGQLTQDMVASRTAMFGEQYVSHLEQLAASFASVPEPSAIGAGILASVALVRRRRHR